MMAGIPARMLRQAMERMPSTRLVMLRPFFVSAPGVGGDCGSFIIQCCWNRLVLTVRPRDGNGALSSRPLFTGYSAGENIFGCRWAARLHLCGDRWLKEF